MFKKFKKFLFCGVYFAASIAASLFLLTCGIDEFYYLPQVPEGSIRTNLNTDAAITLPSLSSFYYAQNYSIYYRIYISGSNAGTKDALSIISPTLVSDFNFIFPNTDPTSTTMGTSADTLFKGRKYYQLEYKDAKGENISKLLPSNGGNISISFPTAQGNIPVISVNNVEYPLYRSSELISPAPNDIYFLNTPELNNPDNATVNINDDVASRSDLTQRYAYVSMYIVAVGSNQATFSNIYSRPTHISIFKLPDY